MGNLGIAVHGKGIFNRSYLGMSKDLRQGG
jgi:hypothetical protein